LNNSIFFGFEPKENIIIDVNKQKDLLIIGSRFLEWDFVNQQIEDTLRSVWTKIFKKFAKLNFVYKKRYGESDNEYIFLQECSEKKIEILDTNISAEEIFATGYSPDLVLSIGSTAVRSAKMYGLNSYALYKIMGLSKEVEKVYDGIFLPPFDALAVSNVSQIFLDDKTFLFETNIKNFDSYFQI
jgi:hypothetical protein